MSQASLMPENLAAGFDRLKPWVSGFDINGKWYGGEYNPLNDSRLELFRDHFILANSVLELGCLEGGHSVKLKQMGVKRVVGFEGRWQNIKKCNYIKTIYGYGDIPFFMGDADTYDFSILGRFDAVLCIGLLYHLANPKLFLHKIAEISDCLFIWTHYHSKISTFVDDGDLNNSTSGLAKKALWLSKETLLATVERCGYRIVNSCEEKNKNGPAITLVLTK